MTDNSSNFDNLQEQNKQVLNNISQLQTQEKQLYDSLEDASLTSEQKKQIIYKINQISQMRINMYSNLKDTYSFYQKNVSASRNTLGQEIVAIDILENELNEAKKRLNMLEDQKYNKLRLVQINTYYGKRYNAHSKLMKTIAITCIPLIILAVLTNKGILPSNLYVFLSGIIIIIGMVLVGLQLIDISNRDNMNWDEYNWYFDEKSADTTTTDTTSSSSPWGSVSTTCIGSACCYEGSTYDESLNICVPNTETTVTSTSTVETTATSTEATTESFRGLDRYGYTQSKPSYINNNIMPIYNPLYKLKF